jgi:hypothetical protein
MTCPRCHCAKCRRVVANERLRSFLVSRETPIDLPDDHDAEQLARAVSDLNDELAGCPG